MTCSRWWRASMICSRWQWNFYNFRDNYEAFTRCPTWPWNFHDVSEFQASTCCWDVATSFLKATVWWSYAIRVFCVSILLIFFFFLLSNFFCAFWYFRHQNILFWPDVKSQLETRLQTLICIEFNEEIKFMCQSQISNSCDKHDFIMIMMKNEHNASLLRFCRSYVGWYIKHTLFLSFF